MNKTQVANLRKLQANLLRLPDAKIIDFDITLCSKCAWGMVVSEQWFADAPPWGSRTAEGTNAPDFIRRIFGVNAPERQFLFQQYGSFDTAALQFLQTDPPPRDGIDLRYGPETGGQGILECVDRIENVLQYHLAIGLEA